MTCIFYTWVEFGEMDSLLLIWDQPLVSLQKTNQTKAGTSLRVKTVKVDHRMQVTLVFSGYYILQGKVNVLTDLFIEDSGPKTESM